jgi:DNA polymerase-1
MQAYFKQFPGVKSYLDGIRHEAAENGYVRPCSAGGGTPRFENQRPQHTHAKKEAIKCAHPGTAADIMKIAMLRLPGALQSAGLEARMLLQVHDELVLECPRSELTATAAIAQGEMENAYQLSVPLKTDAKYGQNWGEMEPLKT